MVYRGEDEAGPPERLSEVSLPEEGETTNSRGEDTATLAEGETALDVQCPGGLQHCNTPEPKEEYVKEETPQELKMSVMWTSGLDQLTMYAFDPEAQEMTTALQEDAHHILSDTGTESQDSGLGYAELEIKEHPIQGQATPPGDTRRKTNPRDPRLRYSVWERYPAGAQLLKCGPVNPEDESCDRLLD